MITYIIALLFVIGLLPDFACRYVAFSKKMSDTQKKVISGIYFIVFVGMYISFVVLTNTKEMDAADYKIMILISALVLTISYIIVMPRYVKEHLFVMGIISNIVLLIHTIGSTVMLIVPYKTDTDGLIKSLCISIVVYILAFTSIRRLILDSVASLLDIDTKDYWNTIWMIPITLYLSSVFYNKITEYDLNIYTLIARYMLGIATVCICWSVAKDSRNINQQKQIDIQLEREKQYYMDLKERLYADREARHNFKHHIAAIKHYVEVGDVKGLETYCDNWEIGYENSIEFAPTGNTAVDGVLYHYASVAKENKIEMDIRCKLETHEISDSDLCCIVGNAIDNAITACSQYDGERKIAIVTEEDDDMLVLLVVNTFDGRVKKKNDKILSKRRKGKKEGIGIASMNKICEANGGTCVFEYDQNQFKAQFLLRR